jgi:hypothetical protein
MSVHAGGRGPGHIARAQRLFDPRQLFAASEAGFWADVSTGNTWQDTARTTPGVVGQPVASWALNTASGVIYATQATLGNRPLLQLDGARHYLAFDGSDDWLETAAIDLSGSDEITLMAAVRKEADAALAVVMELTATIVSNNGGALMSAPPGANPAYGFRARGSVAPTAITYNNAAVAAPIKSVLTGLADISADSQVLRVNGTQVATGATDMGAGNFANDVIYIGRRGGASNPFNGRIYGLMARGKLTVGVDLARAEAWANRLVGAY